MKAILLAVVILFSVNNANAQTDTTKFKSAKDYIKHQEEIDANMTKHPKRKIALQKNESDSLKSKSRCFFSFLKKDKKR
ncbi:hypothetical protein [Niabella ginsengisoli]|uniref:Uncharacterized protein n=1 Tax=Niabella ginsengisoli TaxID=522298 RepID=A0ABS9SH79_9BACT|nr:hypothetical protein [Niabella ginsengisoli]MCH5597707.1 hypothetical protein [Niabella ginsengisoli]